MPFEKLTFERIGKITIIIEPIEPPPLEELTLTINVVGQGTTEPPIEVKYHQGDKITILAVPDEGWVFKDWTYSWIPELHTVENPLNLTLQE